MAGRELFEVYVGDRAPDTNTVNNAGGVAYQRSDKGALAQYCVTGCLGNTYYVDAKSQLKTVLELCSKVDDAFIKQCALYSREKGYLKDMPALLVAILALRKAEGWEDVFRKVIDNGKMLRNFINFIRPGKNEKGQVLASPINGKISLGSRIKKAIQRWLNEADERRLLNAFVGNTPTMKDIIRMTHPKGDAMHCAFYAWVLGKEIEDGVLRTFLPTVWRFEMFKASKVIEDFDGVAHHEREGLLHDLQHGIPFQLLTGLPLTDRDWQIIALQASWQQTRMNLNTFMRHKVLDNKECKTVVIDRLTNKELIGKAKVYPYQLLTAYQNTQDVPVDVSNALQDALEIATENVPVIPGGIIVIVDVSGSMGSPITGGRGVSSKTTCVDVAALLACCILRKNQKTAIIPVDIQVHPHRLNPRDSIVTNAKMLASYGGGGTNLGLAMGLIASDTVEAKALDMVIVISDSESWMDERTSHYGSATAMMQYWNKIKSMNAKAKLVCIDLTPNTTSQVVDRDDVFNIGGFSDNVFDLLSMIANGEAKQDMFVQQVEGYGNDK